MGWIERGLVVCAFGVVLGLCIHFSMGAARDFIVKEAARCLEAPDIDTARVCWDAATLGWKS